MPLTEASPNASASDNHINTLRSKLKAFEYEFRRSHDRNPTADEIKEHSIRDTYKEYDRLRREQKRLSKQPVIVKRRSSTNVANPELPPAPPTPKHSRPSDPTISNTPSKTPRRNNDSLPWGTEGLYESPASARRQRLFGNRLIKDAIGPTPQKTGKVLGLFDSFVDLDVTSTPSKSPNPQSYASPLKPSTRPPPPGSQTSSPRKSNRVSASPDLASPSFSTPRKRKYGASNGLPAMFETPTALRQRVISLDESLLESPPAFRPPPKPKRGLSSLLAELRDMEEHQYDDDEEALKEAEMEAAGIKVPSKKDMPAKKEKEKKQKKDSDGFDRTLEMPPLPDGAFEEEERVVNEKEGEEPQGRVWKKKGLKRQTRRAKMRPVRAVPKRPDTTKGPISDDDQDEAASDAEYDSSASAFEAEKNNDVDSDGGEDGLEASIKLAKKRHAEDVAAAKEKTLTEKGKEAVKKTVRKVSAAAHSRMNFRKLNIKNKNSKGKGGGRFRRR
ncbi:hypothetical protein EX30DRAFT_393504 [Ascodesmis nigricans]|uniref:DNA replication regulator SLD2 n=1 Tax=Ascodesmis nigricans TaxID=341454 RepID=A0A4S2N490_9PEZI|nr:hypothetical protein EX30DRAFT_393504 [Ascodesmis nigricans]